jgi:hypothetical protein
VSNSYEVIKTNAYLSRSSVRCEEKYLEIIHVENDTGNYQTNNCHVYSDLYFKNNKTLNTFPLDLRGYVHTNNNTFISTSMHRVVATNFMPCFKKCFGLLQIVKYSLSDSSDISFNLDKSYKGYNPILNYDSSRSRITLFGELLSRISLSHQVIKKKTQSNLIDLDEITPVDDDNPRIVDDLIVNQIDKPLLDKNRFNPIILEPLSLENIQKKRVINRIYETEQKKLVRITIMYTLAFFALAITTFFIIYLA